MTFPTCSTCRFLEPITVLDLVSKKPECQIKYHKKDLPIFIIQNFEVERPDRFGCHEHEDINGNRWVNFGIPEGSEVRKIETDEVINPAFSTVIKEI